MRYPSGTPTQPEIIAIALSKLDIKPGEVFVDIGCGSGSVSIAAAGLAKRVFAIESREDAVLATSANIKECGIKNISVLKGDAEKLLSDIDFDCAFIGGSKNIEQVLEILIKKARVRFVVSAVRVETVALAQEIMKEKQVFRELLQIQYQGEMSLQAVLCSNPKIPYS